MKNRKVYVTTFCGVAVAMNIVLGIITSALGIPLYLDTLGTVLSAAILGLPGDRNTNRNLCIWRTEWISFGYAGDVTGAGWKNNFSGFLP